MSDRSHKVAKPAAAFGLLATMVSIWWFALRPRRKVELDKDKVKLDKDKLDKDK